MKSKWNMIIQGLAVAGQVATVVAPLVSGPAIPWTVGTIAAVQGATALYAHYRNPDGTPAEVAYERPVKKRRRKTVLAE